MKKFIFFYIGILLQMASADTIPDLPLPIGVGSAEVWNNQIYLFGGSNRWAGTIRYPHVYQYDGFEWNLYDMIPDDNVWDVESVIVGDDVYLVSGWPSGANLIRKYHLPTRAWTYLPSSPNTNSWGNTAAYHDGYIYLFGPLGNVYQYSIADSVWQSKTAGTTQANFGMKSVLYQEEIYIVGYQDSLFFKYTPASDQWTQLAQTPYPVAGCAMQVWEDRIYCIAGSEEGTVTNQYKSILVYDAAADAWEIDDFQLSGSRALMASVIYDSLIYLVGGIDSTGWAVATVEQVTPLGTTVGHDAAHRQQLPKGFELEQNYPNPFNPSTVIGYSLSVNSLVMLDIYSVTGAKIRQLVGSSGVPAANQPAGHHSVTWDGTNDVGAPVASGAYFYRLQAGDFVQSRKMILLR